VSIHGGLFWLVLDIAIPHNAAMGQVNIRRAALNSPTAFELISALNAELLGQYPEPGQCHFRLDVDEVSDGQGAFVIAYDDTGDGDNGEVHNIKPIGCGAVRRLDATTAELKRMYVVPSHRGQGAGRALVAALESEARALGVTRLVLETGRRQESALALYEKCGFTEIPRFGEYVHTPLSVCMAKALK
jgi:putative acetyltransferase